MQAIYDGTLAFDARRHAYTYDGTPLPGVTSIMQRLGKPALINWSARMCADYIMREWRDDMAREDMAELCEAGARAHLAAKTEAAGVGKEVHAYAEARLRGEPTPHLSSDAAQRGADAFEDWLREHDVRPLATERRLMSRQYWYAGTTDFFGYIEGELVVADFKTGKGIYLDYWLQTAGYQVAIEEELQKQVEARWIIRLDKVTGKVEPVRKPHSDLHIAAWLELKRLDDNLKKMEQEDGVSEQGRRRKAAA